MMDNENKANVEFIGFKTMGEWSVDKNGTVLFKTVCNGRLTGINAKEQS